MEVLFRWGGISVYTAGLFAVLAWLWGGFISAKKADEYSLDRGLVYDWIVFSLLFFLVFLKLGSYIGGGLGIVAVWLGVACGSYWLSKKSDIKFFLLMDISSLGVIMGLSWWSVGKMIISLARGEGLVLGLSWWGVLSVLYILLFWSLWRLERVYRFFYWYKRRGVAMPGFVWGVAVGFSFLIEIVKIIIGLLPSIWPLWIVFGLLVILPITFVYLRSGLVLSRQRH